MMYGKTNRDDSENGFSWAESLIRGLVDVFAYLLLTWMAFDPVFGLGGMRVVEVPGKPDGPSAPSGGVMLQLRLDGRLVWNGETASREEVVSRIQAVEAGQPVSLAIETNEAGQGAMQDYQALKLACSRAQVWNRVEEIYRPEGSQSPGGKQP